MSTRTLTLAAVAAIALSPAAFAQGLGFDTPAGTSPAAMHRGRGCMPFCQPGGGQGWRWGNHPIQYPRTGWGGQPGGEPGWRWGNHPIQYPRTGWGGQPGGEPGWRWGNHPIQYPRTGWGGQPGGEPGWRWGNHPIQYPRTGWGGRPIDAAFSRM